MWRHNQDAFWHWQSLDLVYNYIVTLQAFLILPLEQAKFWIFTTEKLCATIFSGFY